MNDQYDNLLREYFGKHKTEISDNGFSDRVTRKLPLRPKHTWILYLSYFLGLTVFLYFGAWQRIVYLFSDFILVLGSFHTPSMQSVVAFLAITFIVGWFAKISFDESLV